MSPSRHPTQPKIESVVARFCEKRGFAEISLENRPVQPTAIQNVPAPKHQNTGIPVCSTGTFMLEVFAFVIRWGKVSHSGHIVNSSSMTLIFERETVPSAAIQNDNVSTPTTATTTTTTTYPGIVHRRYISIAISGWCMHSYFAGKAPHLRYIIDPSLVSSILRRSFIPDLYAL